MHLNRSLTSSMKSGWYLWLLCFLISLAVAQARNHTIRPPAYIFSHALVQVLCTGISVVFTGAVQSHQHGVVYVKCYCNVGDSCDMERHICESEETSSCHSRVIQRKDGSVHLEHFCAHSLTACPSDTHCCREQLCNQCPEWEIFQLSLEELVQVEFPSECNITFTLPPITAKMTVSPESSAGHEWWIAVVAVLCVLAVIAIVACVLCYVYVWSRRQQKSCEVGSIGIGEPQYPAGHSGGSSRGGNTQLRVKTFAQTIKDKERIAQGSYGRVYRAYSEFYGRDLAIKIIPNRNSKSWEREKNIYHTDMLRHPNILAFITGELKDTMHDVELWLVFEYHPRGSLYNYLSNHIISSKECHTFLSSIADGVSYLHSHIQTAVNLTKSTIAHRDLKSDNILIKDDMSCCISDFGMSVKETDFTSEGEVPDHAVGTRRYLAPEILSGTIKKWMLYSYVMADVYSLALVMWEVTRRCNWRGNEQEVPAYGSPYFCIVPDHPTIEDMKKIVVDDEGRPLLEPAWKNSEFMSQVSILIQDSWRPNPYARINAAKISKLLKDLHPVVYGRSCLSNQV